jgi:6-phosphogluconolactonase
MKRKILVLYSILTILVFSGTGCRKNERVLAGGFTEGNEKGMALFELNTQSGNLRMISETDAGADPTFFCFSRDDNYIYSVNEVMDFKGTATGGLTTLKYHQENGTLEKISELPVPYGGPCHISLADDGRFLFIASYSSSSVAVVKIGSDGIPAEVSDSIIYSAIAPVVSHPHMISQDPSGKHIYLTDLGLDRIMIYDLDRQTGKLLPVINGEINVPQGSGPRHFAFNKSGNKMYLINELGSTVMVFNVDDNGILKLVQTMPATSVGYKGNNACAEILISNNGKYLYGSNRGENSIVIFNIGDDGLLTLAGHSTCGGDWPRNFVIDPSGRFLLSGNQKSGDIAVFRLNPKTGIPEGPVSKATMKGPAYLKFIK